MFSFMFSFDYSLFIPIQLRFLSTVTISYLAALVLLVPGPSAIQNCDSIRSSVATGLCGIDNAMFIDSDNDCTVISNDNSKLLCTIESATKTYIPEQVVLPLLLRVCIMGVSHLEGQGPLLKANLVVLDVVGGE